MLAEVFAIGLSLREDVRRRSEVLPEPQHRVVVRLDRLLDERGMLLTELAERVDVTIVNLSVLKTGAARDPLLDADGAVRPLGCQPGDILKVEA